jgi:hypothetical protein
MPASNRRPSDPLKQFTPVVRLAVVPQGQREDGAHGSTIGNPSLRASSVST